MLSKQCDIIINFELIDFQNYILEPDIFKLWKVMMMYAL